MIKNYISKSLSLTTPLQRNFGVNEKAIKIRMKAVGSIGKITKAMKMVASSKMRAEVSRLMAGKNFGVNVIPTILQNDEYHKIKIGEFNPQKILIVPITTDKGLCGGINSNLLRELRGTIAKSDRSRFSIITIGEKGAQALSRPYPDLLKESLNELYQPANFYVT